MLNAKAKRYLLKDRNSDPRYAFDLTVSPPAAMGRGRIPRFIRRGVLLAIVFLGGSVQLAQAVSWSVTTGDWSVPANWGGTLPGENDYAYIENGGTAYVTETGAICGHLRLGGYGTGKTGTVVMTGGTFDARYGEIGGSGTGTFLRPEATLPFPTRFTSVTMHRGPIP